MKQITFALLLGATTRGAISRYDRIARRGGERAERRNANRAHHSL